MYKEFPDFPVCQNKKDTRVLGFHENNKMVVVNPPFFNKREDVLTYIGKNKNIKKALEIGTLAGDFASDILNEMKPKELHLIDTFDSEDWITPKFSQRFTFDGQFDFVSNRFKYDPVLLITGDSVETLNSMNEDTYDFIYIDSIHTYDKLSNELVALERFCKKGTIIGLDDYCYRGVEAALTQWLAESTSQWKILYYSFNVAGMHNIFIEKVSN